MKHDSSKLNFSFVHSRLATFFALDRHAGCAAWNISDGNPRSQGRLFVLGLLIIPVLSAA
jgi:hypothetical protein